MYAVIKGILRENGGPDIGSVRAPLYELQPEDGETVRACAARIRELIAKYC
jgi:N-acetylneuraminate lyase